MLVAGLLLVWFWVESRVHGVASRHEDESSDEPSISSTENTKKWAAASQRMRHIIAVRFTNYMKQNLPQTLLSDWHGINKIPDFHATTSGQNEHVPCEILTGEAHTFRKIRDFPSDVEHTP
jgi:hypothetical protein